MYNEQVRLENGKFCVRKRPRILSQVFSRYDGYLWSFFREIRSGRCLNMSVSTVRFSEMNEGSKERRNLFGTSRYIFLMKHGHSNAALTIVDTLLQEKSIYAAIIGQNTAYEKLKITLPRGLIEKTKKKRRDCRKLWWVTTKIFQICFKT